MNSLRLEKDFGFSAAVHFENRFYINNYDVTLSFVVNTDSMHEQNVAMQRIMHFINNVLHDSILVDHHDIEAVRLYEQAGINVCELPDEPWDQLFALVLLQKLNTIMEGRLSITDMVLGSSMSGGVRYSVDEESAAVAYPGNHWWNKHDISLKCSYTPEQQKVVRLFDDGEWIALGLVWKE